MKNATKEAYSSIGSVCMICNKTVTFGSNKPHSLHKTKRLVKPNIQKIKGSILCTRCLRTGLKKNN